MLTAHNQYHLYMRFPNGLGKALTLSYDDGVTEDIRLIENFAERMSGKEDIWYATNGEIYDYVEAYRNLVFSADMHIAYNPSNIPVWFYCSDRLYCVKAGETVSLLD